MKPFTLPDWDYGEETNQKLREVFNVTGKLCESESADGFIDYMINEVDISTLVALVFHHAPKLEIQSLAECFGFLEAEVNDERTEP